MLRRLGLIAIALLAAAAYGCTNLSLVDRMGQTQKQFDAIELGMTEQQVIELMGSPQKRMLLQGGEGGQETLIVHRWLGTNNIMTVTFDSTGVIGKRKF